MQLELDLGYISPTIDVLGLNPARIKMLHDEGIYTIGELIERFSFSSLLKKKWFGRCTLMKITKKLDELGMGMRDW